MRSRGVTKFDVAIKAKWSSSYAVTIRELLRFLYWFMVVTTTGIVLVNVAYRYTLGCE